MSGKLRLGLSLLLSVWCMVAAAYKLTPYIPDKNPQQVGVIVCPGGSYFWLDKDHEGREVAEWLRENGIAAFVLEYSHGGWGAFAFHVRTKGRSFPCRL